MILELDLGNTRGKWRTVADGVVIDRGAGVIADWCGGNLPAWQGLTRIRVASVLNDGAERELTAVLAASGAPVAFARSRAACAGVVNAYAEPQRLGVDRWLAMLAAYAEFRRAVLVIDAGSALTIDLVAADGRHRGGYIMPGSRLMADTLLRSTDRVRFDPRTVLASIEPGQMTGDCVHGGIALALAGAVQLGLVQARRELGEVTPVLAGGDAPALAALLPGERFEMRPDLVLDGLRQALP